MKSCADCRFYGQAPAGPNWDRCSHQEAKQPTLTGSANHVGADRCVEMRRVFGRCGLLGVLFQKREHVNPWRHAPEDKMMKKYALFGGSSYYPLGGFNDFIATDDNAAVLDAIANDSTTRNKRNDDLDWWHIIDMDSGEIAKKQDRRSWFEMAADKAKGEK